MSDKKIRKHINFSLCLPFQLFCMRQAPLYTSILEFRYSIASGNAIQEWLN